MISAASDKFAISQISSYHAKYLHTRRYALVGESLEGLSRLSRSPVSRYLRCLQIVEHPGFGKFPEEHSAWARLSHKVGLQRFTQILSSLHNLKVVEIYTTILTILEPPKVGVLVVLVAR